MKTLGEGVRDLRMEGHDELEGSMCVIRVGEVEGRGLRAKAWMGGGVGREVRVVRMWDPCRWMLDRCVRMLCWSRDLPRGRYSLPELLEG